MKQECRLEMVWMAWVGIPVMALVVGLLRGWWLGVIVVVAGTAFQLAYVKAFPRVSRMLGYGPMTDVPAETSARLAAPGRVILYTARGCPFCPIIRERLSGLQRDLGFEMVEEDLTFNPKLLAAKGIRSVPVVEAHGEFLVGNATSAELQTFLKKSNG